ncbi:hypothetical protein [Corynebacterium kalidii]
MTLARSWNPGTAYHRPGDIVEVDDEVADWLERTGALRSEIVKKPTGPVVTPAVVKNPEPKKGPEVVEESAAPKRTESLSVWRAYAERQGIDPKGLTKKEIIAAVR